MKRRNQSTCACPNSSMSAGPSPPTIVAQIAKTKYREVDDSAVAERQGVTGDDPNYSSDLTGETRHNPTLILPAEGRNHAMARTATEPMGMASVQGCIKKVVNQLAWDKRGVSTHTVRHCYATRLLEAGVNLRLIQKYLGHAHLTTTMIYLHLTTVGEEAAIAKINAIMKRNA
ncbi:MAG: tyrosine-type recombinase/integrase [Pirellulaceae bacterium]|nr:tyrosine-type recombinase/integrase [Pirellulaceae bacterium]